MQPGSTRASIRAAAAAAARSAHSFPSATGLQVSSTAATAKKVDAHRIASPHGPVRNHGTLGSLSALGYDTSAVPLLVKPIPKSTARSIVSSSSTNLPTSFVTQRVRHACSPRRAYTTSEGSSSNPAIEVGLGSRFSAPVHLDPSADTTAKAPSIDPRRASYCVYVPKDDGSGELQIDLPRTLEILERRSQALLQSPTSSGVFSETNLNWDGQNATESPLDAEEWLNYDKAIDDSDQTIIIQDYRDLLNLALYFDESGTLVGHVWESIVRSRVPVEADQVTAVVAYRAKQRVSESTFDNFLSVLFAANVRVDENVLVSLFSMAAQARASASYTKLLGILDACQEGGLVNVDVDFLTRLIYSVSLGRVAKHSSALYERLLMLQPHPDARVIRAICSAYALAGDLESALRILRSTTDRFMQIPTDIFIIIAQSLGSAQKSGSSLLTLFREIKTFGVDPPRLVGLIALRSLVRDEKAKEAVELYWELRNTPPETTSAEFARYDTTEMAVTTAVIGAREKVGYLLPDNALRNFFSGMIKLREYECLTDILYIEATQRGCILPNELFCSVIVSAAHAGVVGVAFRLFAFYTELGLIPTQRVFRAMLKSCRNGKAVLPPDATTMIVQHMHRAIDVLHKDPESGMYVVGPPDLDSLPKLREELDKLVPEQSVVNPRELPMPMLGSRIQAGKDAHVAVHASFDYRSGSVSTEVSQVPILIGGNSASSQTFYRIIPSSFVSALASPAAIQAPSDAQADSRLRSMTASHACNYASEVTVGSSSSTCISNPRAPAALPLLPNSVQPKFKTLPIGPSHIYLILLMRNKALLGDVLSLMDRGDIMPDTPIYRLFLDLAAYMTPETILETFTRLRSIHIRCHHQRMLAYRLEMEQAQLRAETALAEAENRLIEELAGEAAKALPLPQTPTEASIGVPSGAAEGQARGFVGLDRSMLRDRGSKSGKTMAATTAFQLDEDDRAVVASLTVADDTSMLSAQSMLEKIDGDSSAFDSTQFERVNSPEEYDSWEEEVSDKVSVPSVSGEEQTPMPSTEEKSAPSEGRDAGTQTTDSINGQFVAVNRTTMKDSPASLAEDKSLADEVLALGFKVSTEPQQQEDDEMVHVEKLRKSYRLQDRHITASVSGFLLPKNQFLENIGGKEELDQRPETDPDPSEHTHSEYQLGASEVEFEVPETVWAMYIATLLSMNAFDQVEAMISMLESNSRLSSSPLALQTKVKLYAMKGDVEKASNVLRAAVTRLGTPNSPPTRGTEHSPLKPSELTKVLGAIFSFSPHKTLSENSKLGGQNPYRIIHQPDALLSASLRLGGRGGLGQGDTKGTPSVPNASDGALLDNSNPFDHIDGTAQHNFVSAVVDQVLSVLPPPPKFIPSSSHSEAVVETLVGKAGAEDDPCVTDAIYKSFDEKWFYQTGETMGDEGTQNMLGNQVRARKAGPASDSYSASHSLESFSSASLTKARRALRRQRVSEKPYVDPAFGDLGLLEQSKDVVTAQDSSAHTDSLAAKNLSEAVASPCAMEPSLPPLVITNAGLVSLQTFVHHGSAAPTTLFLVSMFVLATNSRRALTAISIAERLLERGVLFSRDILNVLFEQAVLRTLKGELFQPTLQRFFRLAYVTALYTKVPPTSLPSINPNGNRAQPGLALKRPRLSQLYGVSNTGSDLGRLLQPEAAWVRISPKMLEDQAVLRGAELIPSVALNMTSACSTDDYTFGAHFIEFPSPLPESYVPQEDELESGSCKRIIGYRVGIRGIDATLDGPLPNSLSNTSQSPLRCWQLQIPLHLWPELAQYFEDYVSDALVRRDVHAITNVLQCLEALRLAGDARIFDLCVDLLDQELDDESDETSAELASIETQKQPQPSMALHGVSLLAARVLAYVQLTGGLLSNKSYEKLARLATHRRNAALLRVLLQHIHFRKPSLSPALGDALIFACKQIPFLQGELIPSPLPEPSRLGLRVYHLMRSQGITPLPETFASLINLMGRAAGNHAKAYEIFSDMLTNSVRPTVVTIVELAKAMLFRAPQLGTIEAFWKLMQDVKVEPNEDVYSFTLLCTARLPASQILPTFVSIANRAYMSGFAERIDLRAKLEGVFSQMLSMNTSCQDMKQVFLDAHKCGIIPTRQSLLDCIRAALKQQNLDVFVTMYTLARVTSLIAQITEGAFKKLNHESSDQTRAQNLPPYIHGRLGLLGQPEFVSEPSILSSSQMYNTSETNHVSLDSFHRDIRDDFLGLLHDERQRASSESLMSHDINQQVLSEPPVDSSDPSLVRALDNALSLFTPTRNDPTYLVTDEHSTMHEAIHDFLAKDRQDDSFVGDQSIVTSAQHKSDALRSSGFNDNIAPSALPNIFGSLEASHSASRPPSTNDPEVLDEYLTLPPEFRSALIKVATHAKELRNAAYAARQRALKQLKAINANDASSGAGPAMISNSNDSASSSTFASLPIEVAAKLHSSTITPGSLVDSHAASPSVIAKRLKREKRYLALLRAAEESEHAADVAERELAQLRQLAGLSPKPSSHAHWTDATAMNTSGTATNSSSEGSPNFMRPEVGANVKTMPVPTDISDGSIQSGLPVALLPFDIALWTQARVTKLPTVAARSNRVFGYIPQGNSALSRLALDFASGEFAIATQPLSVHEVHQFADESSRLKQLETDRRLAALKATYETVDRAMRAQRYLTIKQRQQLREALEAMKPKPAAPDSIQGLVAQHFKQTTPSPMDPNDLLLQAEFTDESAKKLVVNGDNAFCQERYSKLRFLYLFYTRFGFLTPSQMTALNELLTRNDSSPNGPTSANSSPRLTVSMQALRDITSNAEIQLVFESYVRTVMSKASEVAASQWDIEVRRLGLSPPIDDHINPFPLDLAMQNTAFPPTRADAMAHSAAVARRRALEKLQAMLLEFFKNEDLVQHHEFEQNLAKEFHSERQRILREYREHLSTESNLEDVLEEPSGEDARAIQDEKMQSEPGLKRREALALLGEVRKEFHRVAKAEEAARAQRQDEASSLISKFVGSIHRADVTSPEAAQDAQSDISATPFVDISAVYEQVISFYMNNTFYPSFPSGSTPVFAKDVVTGPVAEKTVLPEHFLLHPLLQLRQQEGSDHASADRALVGYKLTAWKDSSLGSLYTDSVEPLPVALLVDALNLTVQNGVPNITHCILTDIMQLLGTQNVSLATFLQALRVFPNAKSGSSYGDFFTSKDNPLVAAPYWNSYVAQVLQARGALVLHSGSTERDSFLAYHANDNPDGTLAWYFWNLYHQACAAGHGRSLVLYDVMLASLQKLAPLSNHLARIFHEMRRHGISITPAQYRTIFSAIASQPDPVEALRAAFVICNEVKRKHTSNAISSQVSPTSEVGPFGVIPADQSQPKPEFALALRLFGGSTILDPHVKEFVSVAETVMLRTALGHYSPEVRQRLENRPFERWVQQVALDETVDPDKLLAHRMKYEPERLPAQLVFISESISAALVAGLPLSERVIRTYEQLASFNQDSRVSRYVLEVAKWVREQLSLLSADMQLSGLRPLDTSSLEPEVLEFVNSVKNGLPSILPSMEGSAASTGPRSMAEPQVQSDLSKSITTQGSQSSSEDMITGSVAGLSQVDPDAVRNQAAHVLHYASQRLAEFVAISLVELYSAADPETNDSFGAILRKHIVQQLAPSSSSSSDHTNAQMFGLEFDCGNESTLKRLPKEQSFSLGREIQANSASADRLKTSDLVKQLKPGVPTQHSDASQQFIPPLLVALEKVARKGLSGRFAEALSGELTPGDLVDLPSKTELEAIVDLANSSVPQSASKSPYVVTPHAVQEAILTVNDRRRQSMDLARLESSQSHSTLLGLLRGFFPSLMSTDVWSLVRKLLPGRELTMEGGIARIGISRTHGETQFELSNDEYQHRQNEIHAMVERLLGVLLRMCRPSHAPPQLTDATAKLMPDRYAQHIKHSDFMMPPILPLPIFEGLMTFAIAALFIVPTNRTSTVLASALMPAGHPAMRLIALAVRCAPVVSPSSNEGVAVSRYLAQVIRNLSRLGRHDAARVVLTALVTPRGNFELHLHSLGHILPERFSSLFPREDQLLSKQSIASAEPNNDQPGPNSQAGSLYAVPKSLKELEISNITAFCSTTGKTTHPLAGVYHALDSTVGLPLHSKNALLDCIQAYVSETSSAKDIASIVPHLILALLAPSPAATTGTPQPKYTAWGASLIFLKLANGFAFAELRALLQILVVRKIKIESHLITAYLRAASGVLSLQKSGSLAAGSSFAEIVYDVPKTSPGSILSQESIMTLHRKLEEATGARPDSEGLHIVFNLCALRTRDNLLFAFPELLPCVHSDLVPMSLHDATPGILWNSILGLSSAFAKQSMGSQKASGIALTERLTTMDNVRELVSRDMRALLALRNLFAEYGIVLNDKALEIWMQVVRLCFIALPRDRVFERCAEDALRVLESRRSQFLTTRRRNTIADDLLRRLTKSRAEDKTSTIGPTGLTMSNLGTEKDRRDVRTRD